MQVQGQPGLLYRETLSQKSKEMVPFLLLANVGKRKTNKKPSIRHEKLSNNPHESCHYNVHHYIFYHLRISVSHFLCPHCESW